MNRTLYTLLFYLLMPLVLLRLVYRSARAPAYARRVGERFGRFQGRPEPDGIWIHAVSVGETIAAAPLVRQLLARYPGLAVTISTMTPTGSERVRALFGDQVFHVYAPYDLPFAWRGFLDRIRPRLAVIMETELWPNGVTACWQRGIPVIVANARLSERSARGYARLAVLTREMLGRLDRVAAQTAHHGERFVALGLPAQRLQVTGSIKFDLELPAALRQQAADLRTRWGRERPVWIAASTHEGEEAAVLAAHRQLLETWPDALLVLVPRHPERFAGVARQVEAAGLSAVTRSSGALPDTVPVLLGDTMGELLLLLGAADVAFVGGSLVERGGHNILEPAAWGLPVLAGPSDFNFAGISQLLREAGGMQVVRNDRQLAAALEIYFAEPKRRAEHGALAAAVVEANRGALQALLEIIEVRLEREPRPPGAATPVVDRDPATGARQD